MRLVLVPLFLVLSMPLDAQTRVERNTEVRAAPDGNIVADVRSGTSWQTGSRRGTWTLVTLQGWVDASRFAGKADSFPESVGGTQTLRLRQQPSLEGRILGELRAGAGLRVLERRGTWARIRRDAWILTSTLAGVAAPTQSNAPAPRPAAQSPQKSAVPPAVTTSPRADTSASGGARVSTALGGALRANSATPLRASPSGAVVAQLEPGAIVAPITRDRGWVRVRIDAWVAESMLTPADTSFGATLTAADLRLDASGHKGRVVRWEVEVVSLQTADALRRDLADEEPYLLAMGPGSENAILYIAVPPSLLAEARTLAPLAKVLVTARVRTGRSQPTGVPVLDLLSLVKR